jgi:hypothetical protein
LIDSFGTTTAQTHGTLSWRDLMKCSRVTKHVPILAGLLTALLFAVLAMPLGAQEAPESHARRGFGPAYDAAHETTLIGTVQEVVTKHVAGSPAGMHLLVAGPEGVVDVHVGPFLTQETKDALHTGTPVQIVGSMMQLHDKGFFLARELSIGGRTITIRSARGFLVYPHADGVVRTRAAMRAEENGGAR